MVRTEVSTWGGRAVVREAVAVGRETGARRRTRERPTLERAERAVSWGLAAVMVAASVAGLWVDRLYRDPRAVAEMFRGYDLVALALVAPVLAATLLPALRRSARARLVRAGALAYGAYTYALVVFGTSFNDAFLLHVAALSLSVFGLALALGAIGSTAIGRSFAPGTATRTVAVILGALATSLAAMWGVGAIRFAASDVVPTEGSALVVPLAMTHLGWALDLAFLVPAYALAAVLLWRRSPWGNVLGAAVLIAGVAQQIGYMVALVFQSRAAIPGASAFDPIEPFITLAFAVGAGLLLANVTSPRAPEGRGGSVAR
jgi:hypothetical protein